MRHSNFSTQISAHCGAVSRLAIYGTASRAHWQAGKHSSLPSSFAEHAIGVCRLLHGMKTLQQKDGLGANYKLQSRAEAAYH